MLCATAMKPLKPKNGNVNYVKCITAEELQFSLKIQLRSLLKHNTFDKESKGVPSTGVYCMFIESGVGVGHKQVNRNFVAPR